MVENNNWKNLTVKPEQRVLVLQGTSDWNGAMSHNPFIESCIDKGYSVVIRDAFLDSEVISALAAAKKAGGVRVAFIRGHAKFDMQTLTGMNPRFDSTDNASASMIDLDDELKLRRAQLDGAILRGAGLLLPDVAAAKDGLRTITWSICGQDSCPA